MMKQQWLAEGQQWPVTGGGTVAAVNVEAVAIVDEAAVVMEMAR